MSIFAVIASLVWTIYVERIDAKVSMYFPLHTTGEANPWARGKDGYYSLSKSIRNTVIVLGSLLAIAIIFPVTRLVIAGIIAAMGTVIFLVVKNNKKKQLEDKAKEFDFLENFQPSHIHPNTARLTVFKGEWIWKTFYDIRIPKLADVDDPTERLRACVEFRKIFEVLQANPKLWWSLDRAQKLKELTARV